MKACDEGVYVPQRQGGDISGAAAVMKGCWTMTRPSQLLSNSPLLLLFLLPLFFFQSLLYVGGTLEKPHCHTTFNKDKSLRRAAGDDRPDS